METVGSVGSVDGVTLGVYVSAAHVSVGTSPQRSYNLNAEQVLLLRQLLMEALEQLDAVPADDDVVPVLSNAGAIG